MGSASVVRHDYQILLDANIEEKTMTTGVWVLGDQLWAGQSALSSCAEQHLQTEVIFIESLHHAQELPYHSQKLVLVWSAMRHFAEELRSSG